MRTRVSVFSALFILSVACGPGGSADGGAAGGVGGSGTGGAGGGAAAGGAAGSCSGCLTSTGTCLEAPDNTSDATCGVGGQTCQNCSAVGQTCGVGSVCTGAGGAGGSAGGSTAGGSTAGGSTAGGSAAGGSGGGPGDAGLLPDGGRIDGGGGSAGGGGFDAGLMVSAPGGLVAVPVSSTQINLTWVDNSNNEQRFHIERAPGVTTVFTEIGTTGAGIASYSDVGLLPMSGFSYRVRASNGMTYSVYSNVATANTPALPVPAAPSGLVAAPDTASAILLAWADNSTNEGGFYIERAPGGTTTFTQVASVTANVTTYRNTGLAAATGYTYRVRAFAGAATSPYSASATATTLGNGPGPGATGTLTATARSTTEIALRWVDNLVMETGFRVERAPAGSGAFVQVASVPAGVGLLEYVDSGLTPSTGYDYRLRPWNATGFGPYTNVASATTVGTGVGPAAPSGLSAAAITVFTLSWTDNATNETGFHLERAPAGTTNFTFYAWVAANSTSYSISRYSGSWAFRIRAYNTSGFSAYSNTVTWIPATPDAPTNLTAVTFDSTRVDLQWTDASSNETGFRIERAPAGSTAFVTAGVAAANATSYSVTGLIASTAYDFRVFATNASGASAASNTATATTTAPAQLTQTLYATNDNLLMVSSANTALAGTVYANGDLAVGCNIAYDAFGGFNYVCAVSLIRFNVSALAGRTIIDARLKLYEYVLPGDPIGTFQMAAVNSSWNGATVTYNAWLNMTHDTTTVRSFTAPASTALPVDLDVTTVVQGWVSGSRANNGVQLWDPTPVNPGYTSLQAPFFDSLEVYNSSGRRPQLYVRYQ